MTLWLLEILFSSEGTVCEGKTEIFKKICNWLYWWDLRETRKNPAPLSYIQRPAFKHEIQGLKSTHVTITGWKPYGKEVPPWL